MTRRCLSLRYWILYAAALSSSGVSTVHAADRRISFGNDVVPTLTKAGCNTGVCHAKAGGAKRVSTVVVGIRACGGFRGGCFRQRRPPHLRRRTPIELVASQGVRRKFPTAAECGCRRSPPEYNLLRDWLRQGAVKDDASTPKLVAMDVEPKKATMPRQSTRQLKVTARYSDGTSRDVTKLALFEPNDKAFIEATPGGLVKALDLPGKASVMVRYQGRVAVFSAAIPLGADVGKLPPSKNFIDEAVFANLKELGSPAVADVR